jgi:hypothetical protein
MLFYLHAITKLEKRYKIQECILHTTYKLFEACCLLHGAIAPSISQTLIPTMYKNEHWALRNLGSTKLQSSKQ